MGNIREWFYNNICQPVRNFYHKHISRDEELSGYMLNSTQENLDSLITHTSSSDNDIL